MKRVVVIGSGKIGSTMGRLLAGAGNYQVAVVDRSAEQLSETELGPTLSAAKLDITDQAALTAQLSGKFAVLSAAPFQLTVAIASAAAKAGVHYLDLTEDVESTRQVKRIAKTAKTAFIPQCGLAPGFISIVASDLTRKFDSLDSVRLRVGALPQFPSNALNYKLTWSTDGVINEYIQPCEAVVNGELVEVPALEQREEFSLDGVTYGPFNPSGGLGTLCETLKGKVNTLNYRTIRYPGHAAIMKALLHDLGLRHRGDALKDILEHSLPTTLQDVVIVFVTVSGRRSGRLIQETYANKIYSTEIGGRITSAIQITTAIQHLRRSRSACRPQDSGPMLHPAGGHCTRRVSGEPIWSLLPSGGSVEATRLHGCGLSRRFPVEMPGVFRKMPHPPTLHKVMALHNNLDVEDTDNAIVHCQLGLCIYESRLPKHGAHPVSGGNRAVTRFASLSSRSFCATCVRR